MQHNRKSIKTVDPASLQAMLALEAYGKTCPLQPLYKELIKIRASQINGCAYCLDMHTEDAVKMGELPRRIFAMGVWQESHLFNEEERALLQITEEVTKISEKGITNATYNKVVELFGEKMTAQIIMLIITINAWNRMAIASHEIYKP
ncbi:MAG: carboxymuconolactone decarboxylase family protein [Chitinophagaceae bacterium]|nr:carboxymuconolactone decarboxylase family protein [Chitinophagaceae bacterium]